MSFYGGKFNPMTDPVTGIYSSYTHDLYKRYGNQLTPLEAFVRSEPCRKITGLIYKKSKILHVIVPDTDYRNFTINVNDIQWYVKLCHEIADLKGWLNCEIIVMNRGCTVDQLPYNEIWTLPPRSLLAVCKECARQPVSIFPNEEQILHKAGLFDRHFCPSNSGRDGHNKAKVSIVKIINEIMKIYPSIRRKLYHNIAKCITKHTKNQDINCIIQNLKDPVFHMTNIRRIMNDRAVYEPELSSMLNNTFNLPSSQNPRLTFMESCHIMNPSQVETAMAHHLAQDLIKHLCRHKDMNALAQGKSEKECTTLKVSSNAINTDYPRHFLPDPTEDEDERRMMHLLHQMDLTRPIESNLSNTMRIYGKGGSSIDYEVESAPMDAEAYHRKMELERMFSESRAPERTDPYRPQAIMGNLYHTNQSQMILPYLDNSHPKWNKDPLHRIYDENTLHEMDTHLTPIQMGFPVSLNGGSSSYSSSSSSSNKLVTAAFSPSGSVSKYNNSSSIGNKMSSTSTTPTQPMSSSSSSTASSILNKANNFLSSNKSIGECPCKKKKQHTIISNNINLGPSTSRDIHAYGLNSMKDVIQIAGMMKNYDPKDPLLNESHTQQLPYLGDDETKQLIAIHTGLFSGPIREGLGSLSIQHNLANSPAASYWTFNNHPPADLKINKLEEGSTQMHDISKPIPVQEMLISNNMDHIHFEDTKNGEMSLIRLGNYLTALPDKPFVFQKGTDPSSVPSLIKTHLQDLVLQAKSDLSSTMAKHLNESEFRSYVNENTHIGCPCNQRKKVWPYIGCDCNQMEKAFYSQPETVPIQKPFSSRVASMKQSTWKKFLPSFSDKSVSESLDKLFKDPKFTGLFGNVTPTMKTSVQQYESIVNNGTCVRDTQTCNIIRNLNELLRKDPKASTVFDMMISPAIGEKRWRMTIVSKELKDRLFQLGNIANMYHDQISRLIDKNYKPKKPAFKLTFPEITYNLIQEDERLSIIERDRLDALDKELTGIETKFAEQTANKQPAEIKREFEAIFRKSIELSLDRYLVGLSSTQRLMRFIRKHLTDKVEDKSIPFDETAKKQFKAYSILSNEIFTKHVDVRLPNNTTLVLRFVMKNKATDEKSFDPQTEKHVDELIKKYLPKTNTKIGESMCNRILSEREMQDYIDDLPITELSKLMNCDCNERPFKCGNFMKLFAQLCSPCTTPKPCADPCPKPCPDPCPKPCADPCSKIQNKIVFVPDDDEFNKHVPMIRDSLTMYADGPQRYVNNHVVNLSGDDERLTALLKGDRVQLESERNRVWTIGNQIIESNSSTDPITSSFRLKEYPNHYFFVHNTSFTNLPKNE